MSTTEPLAVETLRILRLRSESGLRVQLAIPPRVTPRQVLSGSVSPPLKGTVLESGGHGDLVGTYWGTLYLVSERFVAALEGNHITGWRVAPVVIDGRPPAAALSLLVITGTSGPILRPAAARAPDHSRFGFYLDGGTWDGSDLFLPQHSRGIHITASAANRLGQMRLRNVEIVPAGLPDTVRPWVGSEPIAAIVVAVGFVGRGPTRFHDSEEG